MEYKIYAGGKFIITSKDLKVKNPFNNEVIANTYLAQTKELEFAITKAQQIKTEMAEMPSFKRSEILMQIASELKNQKESMASILCLESGKPIKHARIEIDRAIQTFIVAAEESKRLPKEYISLDWAANGTNKEGLIKYFPIGLIAGITPFNFPLNLAAHKIAPAIASGNPIIIKPASSTPLCCLELAKIIDNTDLPKGAFSVLPMNRADGNLLVTDERVKLLSFTGSAEIGWQMKKDSGKKRVVLELGGNAAVIVTSTADIELAVSKCIAGAFAYSGQVCIKVQRVFVHKSIFNLFTDKFVMAAKSLKKGNPLEENTDISVLIDQQNADRVEQWVNEAVAGGSTLLCGGKKYGAFFEPTVLTNTNTSMKVNSLEIFGPVVTIDVFEEFSESLQKVNETSFGLQAGVFTNNITEMNQSFAFIEAGAVIINDVPTFRMDHMPYGGIKDSGFGREGVKYAIADMMEPKLLIKDY